MQLQDYVRQKQRGYHRSVSGIRERWQGRILKNKWHLQGEDGAAKYIVQYGKSIKLPKLLALAECAFDEGYPDMANGFYMYAARLEGVSIDKRMSGGFDALKHRMEKMPPVKVYGTYDGFPPNYQPGRMGQTYFADGDIFAFVTSKEVLYQHKGQVNTVDKSLEFRLDEQLRILATTLGSMVVRTQLKWIDFDNCEHDTAEASLQANLALGFETIFAEPILTVTECIWNSADNDIVDIDNLASAVQFVRVRSAT